MILQLHINVSLNRPADRTWRRPPGRPRNKWLDQLRNDSIRPTGDLWRRAVDRGHDGATTRRPRWLRDDDDDDIEYRRLSNDRPLARVVNHMPNYSMLSVHGSFWTKNHVLACIRLWPGSPRGRAILEGVSPGTLKCSEYSAWAKVIRWQQRCVLSLPVLQQLTSSLESTPGLSAVLTPVCSLPDSNSSIAMTVTDLPLSSSITTSSLFHLPFPQIHPTVAFFSSLVLTSRTHTATFPSEHICFCFFLLL